jgi:hypothetical protein
MIEKKFIANQFETDWSNGNKFKEIIKTENTGLNLTKSERMSATQKRLNNKQFQINENNNIADEEKHSKFHEKKKQESFEPCKEMELEESKQTTHNLTK